MDFFTHQEKARRKSKILVLYFLAAVLSILAAVNLAVYAVIFFACENNSGCMNDWLDKPFWWLISVFILLVIITVSGFRILKLRGGGEKVAEMVQARKLDLSTAKLEERRFINVVEEMSIASGVPMPTLYVMDSEDGINAFVAGYKPTEAVMVVTKGALDKLSRDELQGVVGHEFSHILHGDMRLNVRLIGLLAGILAIGQIGMFLLRSLSHSRSSRSSRSSNGGGSIIALALALTVIGYLGVFFGRLIKAAVSRQREFLADASAVQFTRDPGGIAGALRKIAGHEQGSDLDNSHAEEMSHMCFGQSLKMSFSNLFATHPPLLQRIYALEGKTGGARRRAGAKVPPSPSAGRNLADEGALGFSSGAAGTESIRADAAQVTESIGQFKAEHVEYAQALHKSLPIDMLEELHTEDGAKAVVYALLFGGSREDRELRLKLVARGEGKNIAALMMKCRKEIEKFGARVRLPLLDLALPALKNLTRKQREDFLDIVDKLIKADRKVSLFEFVLQTIIHKHLQPKASRDQKIRYKSFKPLLDDIALLLSLVAHTGNMPREQSKDVYMRNMLSFTMKLIPPRELSECTPQRLTETLEKLNALAPLLKKSVLNACADCIVADGIVHPEEIEILRAVAESMDCPMPPLVV